MESQPQNPEIRIVKTFIHAFVVCSLFCMYTLEAYIGNNMSSDMKFPTMWYVSPAKAQTSLRIRAV